jgi:hypothetical protein
MGSNPIPTAFLANTYDERSEECREREGVNEGDLNYAKTDLLASLAGCDFSNSNPIPTAFRRTESVDAGPEAWREMSASERNDRVRIPSLPSLKRVRRPVPSCVEGNETHCCDDDRRSRPTVHSTLAGRSIGAEQFTSRRPSDLGIMQAVITFDLDPADGYTRVYQTYDFEVLPRFRPLGWILERLIPPGDKTWCQQDDSRPRASRRGRT